MNQKTALEILKSGRNVFLTGAAGTGKTYVLNEYVDYLKEHGVAVAVTASTGIAATHIGGMTIHSWSGIGIKDSLSDWDIDAMTQKQYLAKRFEKTKVLIIDEVSMLHANMLDMIDTVARTMKRVDMPFGGMQIVLSGDFFQLPPIVRGGSESAFADSSDAWRGADIRVCYLTKQYRQSDNDYADLLNDIRDGKVSNETHKKLKSRINKKIEAGNITQLYTHNVDVDARNNEELDKLGGRVTKYEVRGKGKQSVVDALKRGVLAPEVLELKKDAVVMFVKNDREGRYVNGTIGRIIGFEYGNPVVKTQSGSEIIAEPAEWSIEENGKVLGTIEQVPLRLAWAITVHKSQGMSLDSAEIDLSKAFTPGQGYVALSRLRSLDGLYLKGLNDTALKMHPYVVNLDQHLRRESAKWEKVIARFESNEIKEMHDAHILDSGGELDVKKVKKAKEEAKLSTLQKTHALIAGAKSLAEIAKARGLKEETVISHIEQLMRATPPKVTAKEIEKFNTLSKKDFEIIKKAFTETDADKLAPVHAKLKGKFTYKDLRRARLFI